MEDPTEKLLQNLNKFIQHVDDMKLEDDPAGNGFNREYRDLREIAATNKQENTFPAEFGKLPYNIKKNRYKDIIPFDEQRVVLEEIDGVEGSDYINASFVMSIHDNEAYIASQGPLPNTVKDFWRMIWEQKVKVVMMACREVEGNKKKCARYWPESVEDSEVWGNINVKLLSVEDVGIENDCVERKMSVTHSSCNEVRVVTQYHYTGWPDHGIPDDIDVILEMIARMRDIRKNDKNFAPVVVHCSAGCGRTGTICAIDYAWEVLQSGKLSDDFSMYNIVLNMREQRQSMIQTPDQYEMAHLCVKRLFEEHVNVIDDNIYANFSPAQDDEYYNVTLAGTEDKTDEVDPYELVGANGFGGDKSPAFKVQSEPKTNNQSLIKKDCLETLDNYIHPESANTPKPVPSVRKPEIKKKPHSVQKSSEMEESESKSKESPRGQNYENVIEKDSYENVGKEDSKLKFKTSVSSKNVEKERMSLPPKPEAVGKSNLSPQNTRKDVNITNSSGNSSSTLMPSGPVFESSGPKVEKPSVNRTISLEGQNITRITIGQATSRVSYIDNKPKPDNVPKKQSPRAHNKFEKSESTDLGNSLSSSRSSNRSVISDTQNDVYSLAADPSKMSHSVASTEGEISHSGPIFTDGAVYSQVSKRSSHPSQSAPPQSMNIGKGDGLYESISDFPAKQSVKRGDSLYAEVDNPEGGKNSPVLPQRGYRQEDHVADTSTSGTGPDKKPGTGNTIMKISSGFQNVFSRGNNDHEISTDTSHIPGFKKNIAKKPKGPKEKPKFWKKILK